MKLDPCLTPLIPSLLHTDLICPKEANFLFDTGIFFEKYTETNFSRYYGLKFASNTNWFSERLIQIHNVLILLVNSYKKLSFFFLYESLLLII